MTESLKDAVAAHVADPSISGLIIETEYEPLGGRAATVAPPTYAAENSAPRAQPQHALTEEAFLPAAGAGGWHHDIVTDAEGQPLLKRRVVLDSVASQSGRAETALWQQQSRLSVDLPAVIISGEKDAVEADDPEVRNALAITVSTWDLAHRHNDAWLKFASQDGETQIWQQDIGDPHAPDANLKTLITQASADNAALLFRFFPNAAIYGFWLSSRAAQRHKLARAYSSEIIGYGAHPVAMGSTKLDPVGGASKETQVTVKNGVELTVTGKPAGTKDRPSEIGFGQLPSATATRAYVCELILQQSSISLQALRALRFDTPEQSNAATTVLTLLAIAGRVLSGQESYLRSGCALVAVDERWGWRRHGSREPESFPAPRLEEIAVALGEALDDAAGLGLEFAPPIPVGLSAAERDLIADRVRVEAKNDKEAGD